MGFVFRPSSLEERRAFYEGEFSLAKLKQWFAENKLSLPQLCAIDAGSDSNIIADRKLKNEMLYFPFRELQAKIKKYVPEDLYYDRNVYASSEKVLRTLKFKKWIAQELVFDIDADNIKCKNHKKGICSFCLGRAFFHAKEMRRELKKIFHRIEIVYSGRGFHLHVLDRQAFYLTAKARKLLSKKFSKFPIDEWVSEGNIKLIRMPFSLNALVSRKVIPIKGKFLIEKTIPLFLKN